MENKDKRNSLILAVVLLIMLLCYSAGYRRAESKFDSIKNVGEYRGKLVYSEGYLIQKGLGTYDEKSGKFRLIGGK